MASSSTSGRERLLATARALFLERGAANVGINEVTDTAGVARMTLYNNFPSKAALTDAVYETMASEVLAELAAMPRARTEQARVLALFDFFARRRSEPHFRGCRFVHASHQAPGAESSVRAIARTYKRALRTHILGLLDTARPGRSDLADQLLLLLDGAVTEAYLEGVAAPAKAAQRAAVTLLHSAR